MWKSFLFYFLILLLPVQLGTFFFFPFSHVSGIPVDYLAPAVYLTDILIMIVLVLSFVKKNTPSPSGTPLKGETIPFCSPLEGGLRGVLWSIIILITFNIIFALQPIIAIYKLLKIIEVVVLFFIVKQTKLDYRNVLIAFTAGALVQLALAVFQVTQGHAAQGLFYFLGERFFTLSTPGIAKVSLQGVEILRAYGTFSHPNSLAGFYLLLYAFVLFRKLHPPFYSPLKGGLRGVFLTITTLLILLSFSKVAIVLYLIVTVTAVLRNKPDCRLCMVSRILVPIVVAVLFLSASGDQNTVEKRIWLMQKSITIIHDHLLTGVGPGNYLLAQAQFPIPYAYFFLQPVHNIFLLIMAELGVPIFLLLSYFIFPLLRTVWKTPGGKMILLVVVLTGMGDHYWWTLQQNILLLPVIFGLLRSEQTRRVELFQSGKRMVQ